MDGSENANVKHLHKHVNNSSEWLSMTLQWLMINGEKHLFTITVFSLKYTRAYHLCKLCVYMQYVYFCTRKNMCVFIHHVYNGYIQDI